MIFDAATFLVRPPSAVAPPSADSRVYATDVKLVETPRLLAAARRPRGVKRAGLMYEQRVTDVLSAIYGDQFVAGPAIQYFQHGRRRLAIPDGILYWRDLAIITEVKLAHTESVWDQLMNRYRPLVRLLHPTLRVKTVEICRSYDPAINVPHSLITSLHAAAGGPALEVLWWKI